MQPNIVIRMVNARAVLPVRQVELRPGYPLAACVFDGDEDPETAHWGAFEGDALVGVASVYRRPEPGRDAPGDAWQIRGMAVVASRQRRGIGGELLRACVEHVGANGGRVTWCNARVGAMAFYARHGFEVASEEFVIPDVGPHRVMRREVVEGA